MDKEELNAFDELMPVETDIEVVQNQEQQLNVRIAYLIHRVFSQNEEGAELLEHWKKSVMMIPADQYGNDLYRLGKHEGFNEHIRDIIRKINQVEKEDV